MNYELLGNGDTHLDWHLFPRVNGDIENYGNNGKSNLPIEYKNTRMGRK